MNRFIPFSAMLAGLIAGPGWAADLPTMKAPPVPPPLATNDIINANNQMAVDFLGTSFGYTEFASFAVPGTPSGGKLDTETRWIPGVNASLSVMRNWFVENFYFNAQVSYSSGDTHYTGQNIHGGGFGSLTTSDYAHVLDTDFRIGKGFAIQSNVMLTPYLGFGSHYWDRGPLPEDYSNGYVGAGLLTQYAPMSKVVLSAYGLIGGTVGPSISVHAGVNSWSGDLGDSAIYKTGASIDYALIGNIHVNAGLDYVYYQYGQSAQHVLAGGTFSEPHSTTSNLMAKVGLGYAF
jgi:hypothetical protein